MFGRDKAHPSRNVRTGRFRLVDRPLRRAMLTPLGFADIFNIERAASAMLRRAKGTARSIAN